MPYYAQLNVDGLCTSVTETHSELPAAPNIIAIDGLRDEYLGKRYDAGASAAAGKPVFVEAPAQPQPAPAWEWLIDHGPFTDRLGAAATFAIDTSSDPAFVAIRSDFARRKWIDLKDARVVATVNYLAGESMPVFGILTEPLLTREQADAVLNTPVADFDNLATRKLYF